MNEFTSNMEYISDISFCRRQEKSQHVICKFSALLCCCLFSALTSNFPILLGKIICNLFCLNKNRLQLGSHSYEICKSYYPNDLSFKKMEHIFVTDFDIQNIVFSMFTSNQRVSVSVVLRNGIKYWLETVTLAHGNP